MRSTRRERIQYNRFVSIISTLYAIFVDFIYYHFSGPPKPSRIASRTYILYNFVKALGSSLSDMTINLLFRCCRKTPFHLFQNSITSTLYGDVQKLHYLMVLEVDIDQPLEESRDVHRIHHAHSYLKISFDLAAFPKQGHQICTNVSSVASVVC